MLHGRALTRIGDTFYNGRMTGTGMTAEAAEKLRRVDALLMEMGRVAIAFSGGTDSTFLVGHAQGIAGVQATAITVRSSLMPASDAELAARFCAERGIPHIVLEVDPLACADVRANGPDRCYHCKRVIMDAVAAAAAELDAIPCDGSNADDAFDYRPGAAALEELGIASPLAQVGLSKAEIRQAARCEGLPRWDAPASACLASRIPYGTPLAEDALLRVAQAEQILRAHGSSQVRVRAHGDVARIEVPAEDMASLVQPSVRTEVSRMLHGLGFAYVAVDMDGYRMGSLNEGLGGASDGT